MSPGEKPAEVVRPPAPPQGYWDVLAITKEINGQLYKLRGRAWLTNGVMLFQADEIDWNKETHDLEARGHVYFQHFEKNEKIWCDKLEYNTETERGTFTHVIGMGQPRIDARPGILTSTNPYYFQGDWAERIGDKYILYKGWITDCRVPDPWWTLRGPKFDIIPGERALAYRAVFRLKHLPLFYTPYFRKSLEKEPRHSGFLIPNIGNSSRLGKVVGLGYYWAINRSYDATYRFQDFTARGYAHHVEVRAKPTAKSDFDALVYGVQDRGLAGNPGSAAGGLSATIAGSIDLGDGFFARGLVNYLSSYRFRQNFTYTFNEAINSESNSVFFVTRDWSSFAFNADFERSENFQSAAPGDAIVIRKLPEADFSSRDRQPWMRVPVWVSFESAAGLLQRSQPLFQTRQFTPRLDLYPRVLTALRWKDFHLIPSFAARETHYGESLQNGHISGQDINRFTREFSLDLILPSLARTFNRKTFLGDKLKHVIEPRASFLYVGGVDDFSRILRFDETDLVTNTKQVELSLTNRLYAKRGDDVTEVLSWQLWQRRYFDPTFGGALVPGQRNVFLSTVDLTEFSFLDRPRGASPVVSMLRASPVPGVGVEWRADYDAASKGFVNSGFTADMHVGQYFLSAGHNLTRSSLNGSQNANQFRWQLGYGNENRKGWNAAFSAVYDYTLGVMQFATMQVTYNTDCCGISVQFRRFSFGSRNENHYLVAFKVANVGQVGTLKRQERLF